MSRMVVIPLLVLALAPALVLGADKPAVANKPASAANKPPSAVSKPARVADKPASAAKLSAAAIVERNIAARGGPGPWHAVQTLSWSGKMNRAGGCSSQRIVPELYEFDAARIAFVGVVEDFIRLHIQEAQAHGPITHDAFQMARSTTAAVTLAGI